MMKYSLQDLIDIRHFQELQERLNKIYSFPSAIIDNDGKILTATAWQEICTKFHRQNKDAEKICIKSDQYIKDHIHEANPALTYRCPHGLVDNAAPIVIDGVHYGNFFTGQFFLEEPNLERFRDQAKKYGFDEEAYLRAVKKVPIWTQEQLDSYLFFIKGLITVISESGLKRLREIENRRQIQKSEERYRSILKASLDGYWLTDTKGRLLEVNGAYCRMSGYNEKELLTMSISDLENLETQELVAEHMKKVILKGSDRFESKHRRKDGTIFDVEVSVQFRTEDGGQCVCFIRDITDQKKADKSLRDREAKYRLLVENQTDLIVKVDLEGHLLFVSPSYCDMFGKNENELLGKKFMPLVHEDDREMTAKAMEALYTPPHTAYVEQRAWAKDGWRWFAWSDTAVLEEDGAVKEIIGVGRDITDRKQAEEALKKSDERLKLALDSVSDAIWDWRVDTGEVYFSSRWYTMLGYAPYELPQEFETWRNLLHPDDLPDSESIVFSHLEMAEPFELEFRMRTKDNQWRWILARGKTVEKDEQGKAVRMLGTHMDITERKEMEERLRQAQKLESIGSLAGGIAHDFNNILFPIVGMAEILLEDLPPGSLEYENAQEIFKAGRRGSDLVKQILAFSRQSEHKMIPTRVQNILKEVIKLSRSSIPTNVEIGQDIQQNCGMVMADPTQVHQVAMNIITNAYHSVEDDGGKISISLKEKVLTITNLPDPSLEPGKHIILSVSDNGQGIPPEAMNKIFDPYFTTKERGKGTGLGLAVVHGIILEHRGAVKVTSEIGKGATFDIYLPLMDKSDRSEPNAANEAQPTGNERILLVDDEEPIARLGRQMLERLGYMVTERNSSTDALKAFGANPYDFDLVITDMTMPNMTGDQLTKALKKIRSDIPVIICTGFSEKMNQEKAEAVGIKGFLMKPVVKSKLAQIVRNVLDEPKG
jgi:PAS domain S-box-containing protein